MTTTDGVLVGQYEPPCVDASQVFNRTYEQQLAPGVRGFAFRLGDMVCIPMIVAEREGSGDVGRFLDVLSPRCVIVGVTSPRLTAMLVRRGYVRELWFVFGEMNDAWRRCSRLASR